MNQDTPNLIGPKLRLLDTRPYKDKEREGLLLLDRNGLFEDPVFVPAELLPILGAFTGLRDSQQIAADLGKEMGCSVPVSLVDQVVAMLDEKLCLEGERAERALQQKRDTYLSLPSRPFVFAGTPGYPSEPAHLRSELDRILEASGDSGVEGELLGLVAPHIDLSRGRLGYATSYSRLALEETPPDLVLVFGTGHGGPSTLLVPSTKDFETPLGVLPTDQELVQDLLGSFPELSIDEPLHQSEHSLEFQSVFLAHLFRGRAWKRQSSPIFPKFVFFLTGSLGENPDEEPGVQEILEALWKGIESSGKKALVLAGADLSHVGPFFGDENPVSREWVSKLSGEDRRDLRSACNLKLGQFVAGVQEGKEKRRVCGTTPIYFVGKLVERMAGSKKPLGRILHYGASQEEGGNQCVTWASLAFEAAGQR
jgi:AmmeMemoRadiSam system protein B